MNIYYTMVDDAEEKWYKAEMSSHFSEDIIVLYEKEITYVHNPIFKFSSLDNSFYLHGYVVIKDSTYKKEDTVYKKFSAYCSFKKPIKKKKV